MSASRKPFDRRAIEAFEGDERMADHVVESLQLSFRSGDLASCRLLRLGQRCGNGFQVDAVLGNCRDCAERLDHPLHFGRVIDWVIAILVVPGPRRGATGSARMLRWPARCIDRPRETPPSDRGSAAGDQPARFDRSPRGRLRLRRLGPGCRCSGVGSLMITSAC